ncbi:MscS Mechanosensitive ion channel [Bacteroides heparinolyticus]|uniref:MscS Mechanosensitive ion channel n=2 Tax=Prevotella heparinolytica TaxID=28113 RepID=A0A449I0Y3_9BACE|nr:mechanosensitive ion channel domain-containing protein [Bacteroides heparinolyticus]VFB13074.1 MscS Mechanosensitive ion channel [Bacteroides heparinolyticus]
MLLPLLLSAITDQASELSFSKLQYLVEKMMGWGVDIGGRIISAAIIYFIGRILISLIKKFIAKVLVKRNIDAGIQSFVRSLVNILLTVLLVVAVIGKLGIETTSFAALLASAGVAIGMALSGNLQNFAGGLVILLLRPYKVGDWIESQGVSGTVREIQIFHTILTTADNKVIYIPNGALSSGTVINYSKEDTRRVDWVIGVEYGEDYNKVEETVRRIIAADKRILNTPEPFLALHALADSSVNVVIRVWVKSQDYWGVYFDMNRIIYSEFNKEGISFPFPQLTVHQAKE